MSNVDPQQYLIKTEPYDEPVSNEIELYTSVDRGA